MKLRYFSKDEFRGYYDDLSTALLFALDQFRHEWGAPVRISPAEGAIIRRLGPDKTSGHNIDKWGQGLALDIMPEGMETAEDRKRAFDIATRVGFLGVGIYPDWKPSPGLHVDMKIRSGRSLGNPGRWSAYRNPETGKQEYFDIERAFEED